MSIELILLIVLILLLLGALPTWPYSRNWGYYPVGGLGLLILIILFFLIFTGPVQASGWDDDDWSEQPIYEHSLPRQAISVRSRTCVCRTTYRRPLQRVHRGCPGSHVEPYAAQRVMMPYRVTIPYFSGW